MRSVVLLSGGLDSTVLLATVIGAAFDPHALTVDYGQVHRREIDAAREIARYYDVEHTVVEVDPILFGGSALTGHGEIPAGHADGPDSTYVPARNTVLLALAAAQAESIDARAVFIGCNADDEAGYPDCRREFIESYRNVIQMGTLNHVWIDAPLIGLTKQSVLAEARRLNVPLHLTWSCYRGGEQPCGACGACELMAAAV